jgi:hypothetical protein
MNLGQTKMAIGEANFSESFALEPTAWSVSLAKACQFADAMIARDRLSVLDLAN